MLFVTGSPPIYDDSTLTTKLLGGFKLRVGAARTLVGVGPGRTSCGPAPTHSDSVCAMMQPVDGFDVRPFVEQALAAATTAPAATLAIELEAYALEQPAYNISRAVQAVLVLRYSPEGVAPDVVFGTNAGADSGWLALAADAVYNPGANKDSGWCPYFSCATQCALRGRIADPFLTSPLDRRTQIPSRRRTRS